MSTPIVYNLHMGLERLPQETPKSLGSNQRALWIIWEKNNASGYCDGLSIWGWPVDMCVGWVVNGCGKAQPTVGNTIP